MNIEDLFKYGVTPKTGALAGKRFAVSAIRPVGLDVYEWGTQGTLAFFKNGSYDLWREPNAPFEKGSLDALNTDLSNFDPWEARRYELAKEFVKYGLADIDGAVAMADELITKLKKSPDATEFVEGVQMDDGYENVGIGEIVEYMDGPEHLKKFAFTDRKDIVGFRGDSGRWLVGDRVKVYIKRLDPAEEERPVP